MSLWLILREHSKSPNHKLELRTRFFFFNLQTGRFDPGSEPAPALNMPTQNDLPPSANSPSIETQKARAIDKTSFAAGNQNHGKIYY